MLYIVSTPIGNLKDITYRAVEILKSMEYILCEDSRRTGKLLKNYDISVKMHTYNDYNKIKKTPKIIEYLKEKDLALVSDNGTPGISDPGFYLVRECTKNNIEISPIPGCNAAISGLVCSGLPTDKFTFIGFLPKSDKKKKDILNEYNGTIVSYESPHRIQKTLEFLNKEFPNNEVVIAREITKKFEEFLRGKPCEIINLNKKIKGEIVLMIYL